MTPGLVPAGMDEVGVRPGLRRPRDDLRSTAAGDDPFTNPRMAAPPVIGE